jgi:hypothetical protein
MSYIYKGFDNLYMLWMCIWMCPHHVTAANADQAFTFRLGGQLTFSSAYIHTQLNTTFHIGITIKLSQSRAKKHCIGSVYSCTTPPTPPLPTPSPSIPTTALPHEAFSIAAAVPPRSLTKLAEPLWH